MSVLRVFRGLKESLKVIRIFKDFPLFFAARFGFVKDPRVAEVVLWNGIRYKLDPENIDLSRFIIKEVWADNVYNLTREDVSKAEVIVDVGASIGDFSLFAAVRAPRAKVYSFEPNPDYFHLLKENIKLNGLGKRIHPFQQVVSSSNTSRKLFLSRKSPTRNSLLENDFLETGKGGKSIKVRSMTLGAFFEASRIKNCDFLKLDCEGGEFDILLKTSPEVLKRIRKIALEYHDGVTNYNHRDLVQFLEEQGFSVSIKSLESEHGLGFIWAVRKLSDG